uniref:Mutator-like transposase domain-containing protein n=1 Tax=Timema genevievae TaxID=629358 RepID=A0A7R9PHI3_TIMGE|nr:unnamed protein product [Timema genevievae]
MLDPLANRANYFFPREKTFREPARCSREELNYGSGVVFIDPMFDKTHSGPQVVLQSGQIWPECNEPGISHSNSVWEEKLEECMRQNGVREREIALEKGHVDADGFPYITVYQDGGWCTRSYGHAYNASSGVACIIGAATNGLLYIGVKNKYCYICSQTEPGKESKEHKCYKNYQGTSTGMEKVILIQGFRESERMHNLRYKYIVSDGARAAITDASDNMSNSDVLCDDLHNGPYHVFGHHSNCKQTEGEEINKVLMMSPTSAWSAMINALNHLVTKADKLVQDQELYKVTEKGKHQDTYHLGHLKQTKNNELGWIPTMVQKLNNQTSICEWYWRVGRVTQLKETKEMAMNGTDLMYDPRIKVPTQTPYP